MSHLIDWGFQPRFELPAGLIPARVTRAASGLFRIVTEAGPQDAEISGRLEYAAASALDLPVTGDWVAVTPTHPALIVSVLPRVNCFTRATPDGLQALAANIDLALLVMGLDGDYNPRRLERYLLLCREHQVPAAVVLNKRDLCPAATARAEEIQSIAPSIHILTLSALTDNVPAALQPLLSSHQTAVLLGSSGAGKSTILNCLSAQSHQPTAAVRESDSRGRHTTTARELFLTPHGFLILDVPGLRAVGVSASPDAVSDTFADIEAAAENCRFKDCNHDGEPGCSVAANIHPSRLAAFRKLSKEAAHEIRRHDPQAARAQKEKWKQIHRFLRQNPKPR